MARVVAWTMLGASESWGCCSRGVDAALDGGDDEEARLVRGGLRVERVDAGV
jgi:hypothetical protein